MTLPRRNLFAAALAVAISVAATGLAPDVAGQAPDSSPHVAVLTPPDFWGEYAIWGATGVDRVGRVYFGMTSNDDRGSGSAHLFELDPETAVFTDRGNVVGELERLGLRRPGETQMKIHSRIVEGADGLQYFASMDESGEAEDGSRLPTWGGHLWRRNRAGTWQHLATTKEALIAVAAGGPFVYALGYFDHVVYQFDTRTSRVRSVAVGAAGGHVSRNFFATSDGSVYAPRVRSSERGLEASLVQFDAGLTERTQRPLPDYFDRGASDSHGIVGIAPDDSGGWYFTTSKGRLYRVVPTEADFSLQDLGWMHPAGPRYPSGLFRDEAAKRLYAIAMPNANGGREFDWISRDDSGRTAVAPLPFGQARTFPSSTVIYGSMTRDKGGRAYVVGTRDYKPVILQITPSP